MCARTTPTVTYFIGSRVNLNRPKLQRRSRLFIAPTQHPNREAAPSRADAVAAIRERVEELAELEVLKRENAIMRTRYAALFPEDIPPVDTLPTQVYHHLTMKDANLVITKRQYTCPKKYCEAFRTLLEGHLVTGRMRPSSSPYASPAFLVPKADPAALPRWVNDYRQLNANTVPDAHPLPSIPEILSDVGKGRYWGKIDMTNSFFQTKVHPDDIQKTAVTTPFGLYEWTVMPQGLRNAPATHQRRMFEALRPYIGTFCHVYVDDIAIWSKTLDEHRDNVVKILEAPTGPLTLLLAQEDYTLHARNELPWSPHLSEGHRS